MLINSLRNFSFLVFCSLCLFAFCPKAHAGTISVSGTLYAQGPSLTNNLSSISTAQTGSSYNVALRVNGGSPLTTTTNSSTGAFSFSSVSANAGDVLTAYVYGNSDSSSNGIKANTVTITDGTTNISDLQLVVQTVTVRSDDGAATTSIANMAVYSKTQNPNNFLFTATTGSPNTLVINDQTLLYIPPNKGFKPAGNTTIGSASLDYSSGGLMLRGSWQETGTETFTDYNNFDSLFTGQFIPANGTVVLNGATEGFTWFFGRAYETFNNLTIGGASTATAVYFNMNGISVNGNLHFTTNSSISTAYSPYCDIFTYGNIIDSGSAVVPKSIELVTDGATNETITVSGSGQLGSLQIWSPTSSTVLGSNLQLSGRILVDSAATFDLAGYNITGNSSNTVFSNNGTVTLEGAEILTNASPTNYASSTVEYYGSGTATTSLFSTSFYNLVATSSTGKTLVFPSAATTTVSGSLSMVGASGSNIVLKNDYAGTDGAKIGYQAVLSVASAGLLNYLTVYDNNAEGTATPLEAYSFTNGGNTTNWASNSDSVPPTVSNIALDSPTDPILAGAVTLSASASDNVAVKGVQFWYGTGTATSTIGSLDTSSPYSSSWNTSSVPDGTYYLFATAIDTSNNYATSSNLFIVEVSNNEPVTINIIVSQSASSTAEDISWETSGTPATTQVQYGLDANYGSYSTLNSSLYIDHQVTLSNLLASTTYHFVVGSVNEFGSSASSSDETFTTNPFTITPTAGSDGSISPSSDVYLASGGSQTFTITPDSGYQVDTLTVDGSAVSTASSYSFSNVSGDHTIAVTFSAVQSSGGGGGGGGGGSFVSSGGGGGGGGVVNLVTTVVTSTATTTSSIGGTGCLPGYLFSALTGKTCPVVLPVPATCPVGALFNTQTGKACPKTTGSNQAIYVFSRNLFFGSVGPDVVVLQKYLNAKGFKIALSGPGSPGKESDRFGSRTQQALARFQKANGIKPPTGNLGPATRAFIKKNH